MLVYLQFCQLSPHQKISRHSEWINVMRILFIEQYLENVKNKLNLSFIFNQLSFRYEK
jgi:hypothetical protein